MSDVYAEAAGGAAEEQTRRRAGASRGSGHASAFAISSLYMAYFAVHSLAVSWNFLRSIL